MRRVASFVACLGLLAFAAATGMAQHPVAEPERSDRPEVIRSDAQSILRHVRAADARLTVLNFWATWCSPCKEEFPEIVDISIRYAPEGVRVVFVSVDFEEDIEEARRFLDDAGWTEPSFLKVGKDHEFVAGFNSPWTGAVPATLILDSQARLVEYVEGQTTFLALSSSLDDILQPLSEHR